MRSSTVLAPLLVAAACNHPADPESLQDRITRLVPPIVDESAAAATGADPAFAAMDRGLSTLDLLAPGMLPAFGADEAFKVSSVTDALGEDGETGADIANDLNTRIFTDANYDGDGVYRIPTSELCADALDTDCADAVARAQLRIRAELAGDGVDFTLLVGEAPAEPVTVKLRTHLLSVSVDLGELADAVRDIVQPEPGATVELAGVASARLDVLGTAHVAVAVTIDDPIHVVIAGAAGGEPLRLDTEVAAPLVRVEMDGAAVTGSAQLGLGSTQVHVPDDDGGPAMDIDLPGISALAELAADQVSITDLSFGSRTTAIDIGGTRAVSFDLNRDLGRAVDLTIAGTDADATFTVHPALDLRVAIDHTVLGDPAPVYDVTRVALDGAAAPALHTTLDQLAVAAGVLTLETNPVGYGATFTAGQCVGEEARSDVNGDYSVLVPTACQ